MITNHIIYFLFLLLFVILKKLKTHHSERMAPHCRFKLYTFLFLFFSFIFYFFIFFYFFLYYLFVLKIYDTFVLHFLYIIHTYVHTMYIYRYMYIFLCILYIHNIIKNGNLENISKRMFFFFWLNLYVLTVQYLINHKIK